MYIAILLSLLSVASFAADKFTSSYSSLENCRMIRSSETDPEPEIDYFFSQCKSHLGFQVFHNGGDLRSWIELKKGNVEINLYGELIMGAQSSFPSVGSKVIEWRLKNGKLHALIVRMVGSDEEGTGIISRLVVVRINGNTATHVGTARTNEEARQIADAN